MNPNDKPTDIPRTPLKIIAVAYVMCFVGVPVAALIRAGEFNGIPVIASCGLTAVAAALGSLFIQRLFLWFYYTFFWYISAALALASICAASTFIIGFFTLPIRISAQDVSPPLLTLFIPGAIIGIVALGYVFLRRGAGQGKADEPPTPSIKTKAPDLLAERKRKLGLDD